MTEVKICGIKTPEALDAAVAAGATYLGFVFCEGSPRYIDNETAKKLTNKTPSNLFNVGLFVDPKPSEIQKVLDYADLDMIQLHGNETLQNIQMIRGQFGLPVIKAIKVRSKEDLDDVPKFEKVCDWLLFDAKSDKAAGGTGERFDWSLMQNMTILKPWMLAGGLNADNVSEALAALSPRAVDVSSGVETAPGEKDITKIKDFIAAVQQKG